MIRFGPSGNSDSFYAQGFTSTQEMPAWVRAMGLSAFEYSFGRGVRLRPETGQAIAIQAKRHDIQMSVHLPYYINLAAEDAAKRRENIRYFLDGLRAADSLGAVRAVFHPGSVHGDRGEALARARALLKEVLAAVTGEGLAHIALCPETMGKFSQLGTLEEVIDLCQLDGRLIPTLDFGHLYARSLGKLDGSGNTYDVVLDALVAGLGKARAKKLHIHFSRIEFTAAGEKRHLRLSDPQFGPDHEPLCRLLAQRKWEPVVISESRGTMAEDALTLQQAYLKQKALLK